jgi:hypothetical protein
MFSVCSSIVAYNNAVLRQVKAFHKLVYIYFRKQIKFGSFDRIYLYQLILRYVLKQSELKYVKELSFHSVFSFHFRYLEHLNMRKDIHKYWLSQLTEHLQMDYNFTFLSYVNRESKMLLWLISLSEASEIQQLIGEKAKHYHSEIEEFSNNNHHLCQDCNIDFFLEDYEEICSVIDVFEQELLCVVEITYYGYILSEVTLPSHVNEIIALLTKKAKTDPIFKKRIKLYQRISSMILYFMQFIPEYRKSTICMRFIILLAEKSVKMSI